MIRVEEIRLVKVEIGPGGASPKTLVERAVKMKKDAEREARRQRDSSLIYDDIWCVFDVDDHPKLADAKQQADAHQIRVAVSNPCFELWVLLHLKDQTAHIERGKLKSICSGVMDGKFVNYLAIQGSYADAVRRAVALDKRQSEQGSEGGNPTTRVYLLTESLLGQSRAARLALIAAR